MEGLERQRTVKLVCQAKKHGCQQHILYRDILSRGFTEEADLNQPFVSWFDRKSCTMSQSTHNASSSEEGLHFKHNLLLVEPLTLHLITDCHWFTVHWYYFPVLDIVTLFSCLLCSLQDEKVTESFCVNLPALKMLVSSVVVHGAENRPLCF